MTKSSPQPKVIQSREALSHELLEHRRAGRSIGLVPTMGALHAGHASLVDAATRQCGVTVVTIFVNPTQFAPHEDYARYPRTLDADLKLLAEHRADLVFTPTHEEVYPPGHATRVEIDDIATRLEGMIRPGHFAGVATVVLKFFNMCAPDVAFFGQKDYQQALVIRRMVADLNVPVKIEVCPTIRDADGLALSSRNAYLSPDERRQALAIPRSLQAARELIETRSTTPSDVEAQMQTILRQAGIVEIDYAAAVDPQTLMPVTSVGSEVLVAVAARIGPTRLIDNELIS